MNTPTPPPAQNEPGSPAGDSVTDWRLVAVAAHDPLLLARALQKIAVPEIELHAVRFETGGFGHPARLELVFSARADRARLASVRMQKIIGMQGVELRKCVI
jgi:hypothetical protein